MFRTTKTAYPFDPRVGIVSEKMEKISSVRAVVSPSSRFDSRTSEEPRDRNKVYCRLWRKEALFNQKVGVKVFDFTILKKTEKNH